MNRRAGSMDVESMASISEQAKLEADNGHDGSRPRRQTPAWLLVAGAVALAFYLVNAIHYGNLPLRIEESEWPPMAKAVYETGKPVTPAAEMHRLRFNEDLSVDQGAIVGAWHPPLYIYTLGVSMAFLGTDSPHALRIVGVLGLLLSVFLVFLIAREVTARWRLVGGVAGILLLFHPYAIQGSLFLDIDTSVYAPPALLLVWLAIRYGRAGVPLSNRQILALGGALALLTWTKMTTTVVILGVLVVWWLLSRDRPARSLLEAAAFTAVGAALFFSTYALWCWATDIPFSYTFDVTFVEKSNRLLSEWSASEDSAHWHLRWFGAGAFLLALVYLIDLLRNLASQRRLRNIDLLFLIGAGILIQYVVLSPTGGTYQGKYAFPALAMLILPICWLLLRTERGPVGPLLWLGALVIGLVAAKLMPDVLIWLSYWGDYGTWGFELRTLAIAGAAMALAWFLRGRRGFAGGVIIVLVVLLGAQAVRSYRADSSPLYPIPDTAEFKAAVSDINAAISEGEVVVVPKDMGFYVDGLIIEGEDAFARGDARLAAVIRRYPEIIGYARDSFGPPTGPLTEEVLSRCFPDRREYGLAIVQYRVEGCR